jgi:uncharacterized protein YabE (DUF348 family)
VAAALIAGTTAFVTLDKTVTISVDGTPKKVRTFATTVGGALDRAGIALSEHDALAPARDTKLRDGSLITIRHGRLLSLTIDGKPREVWVTADTVDEALAQAGARVNGAVISASRSGRVPLSGLSLDVRTPQTVTVLVDGHTRSITSTALTLDKLLEEAQIPLGDQDLVSLPLSTYPATGQQVTITRISTSQVQESEAIPFGTQQRNDGSLYVGTSKVVQNGKNGVRVRTFALTFTDGKLTDKKLIGDQVTEQPTPKVIAIGTKPKPKPKPQPTYSTSPDGLNWAALRKCESGGNYQSRNAPFYGAYQFMISTWASVGGSGNPADASPAEQDYRAQLLYKRSGRAPWPYCGRFL